MKTARQTPAHPQNYNRYGYALNNPLKYTDPTGYQTAAPPGGGNWLGGGGGQGESSGWGELGPHWSHYMPNVFSDPTYYYYDSQGYYHKGTYFGGDEIVSFDQVMEEYILPNSITTIVSSSYELNHKDYQFFRGLFFSDGQSWYVEDGIDALVNHLAGVGNGGQKEGSAGGGLPSGLDYTNNSVNTGAFVASEIGGSMRLMKSGSLSLKYYASAWNGGSRAAITTYNLTKWGSRIGQGTSFVTAGLGTVNFMLSNETWGDYGKLGISYLSAGLTYFPEPITTGIGIGIGFIDAAGGFNGFYDYLDINQQLYNSTGGIILPMNGIPQFIP